MKIITLQTRHTTYQMGVADNGFLLHLYYGKTVDCPMDYLLTYYDRGFSMNPYDAGDDSTFSADALPMEYPCYGNGDYRRCAFNIRNAEGVYGCDLRFQKVTRREGKYSLPGLPSVYADDQDSETVEILLEDPAAGVRVTLLYGVLPELDVITRSAVIENIRPRMGEPGKASDRDQGESIWHADQNACDDRIWITKAYSACLDFLQGEFDVLHFYGRHGMERNLERHPVIRGVQSYGSLRGMSSHQHNPFVILSGKETCEEHGACYALSFLYSGNFNCEVEKDQYSQVRIGMGIHEEMFEYPLSPGSRFYTPEVAMAYTGDGFGELSWICHRLIRHHVCRGPYKEVRRPILINSWEAAYFDFNGDTLLKLAKTASELGIEMLVLDDGWFGGRSDDLRGLGDWTVNEEKLGGTLDELVQKIHGMGMKFGLWIEPEMVNEDSDLYRHHPDWAYVVPGRRPVRGRHQLVLDFSRREIVDYIFKQIAGILDSTEIDYIKMDMNRGLYGVYSRVRSCQNSGEIMHDYVLGVYDFLERLNRRYPRLLVEGCAGGGGRFDAGMLYYTPQIWCSDNTDPIERIRIQYGTSFGYPISAVGSHVSASPNHQTGRCTDLYTRSVVAMAGSFGYELDLEQVTESEKEEMKTQIRDYKRYWDLIHNGRYYRLCPPDQEHEMAAWNFTSEDQSEALLNVVSLTAHSNGPVTYIRCKGLDPDARYRMEMENDQIEREYSGSALMEMGIPIPIIPGEYKAWQIYFKAI